MIHAKDALRLPDAQLTDDDRAIVDKLLRELDDGIRRHMKQNGFEFTTNNTNAAAMFVVMTILQDHGFVVQCTPIVNQSRIAGGQGTHVGYQLHCVPSAESIKEARETLKKTLQ
jgi:hypothetical protein